MKNESHGETKDGQEYTSDGDGSIAEMTEKMRPKKKTKGKSINRNFTIDPRDDRKNPLKAHFEKITHGEKSLSKVKLQEFLQSRYKDFVAKRITIQMDNYMGNFKGQNQSGIEFPKFCEGLDSLFNQDQSAIKKFAFAIFDVNGDKKLSE